MLNEYKKIVYLWLLFSKPWSHHTLYFFFLCHCIKKVYGCKKNGFNLFYHLYIWNGFNLFCGENRKIMTSFQKKAMLLVLRKRNNHYRRPNPFQHMIKDNQYLRGVKFLQKIKWKVEANLHQYSLLSLCCHLVSQILASSQILLF